MFAFTFGYLATILGALLTVGAWLTALAAVVQAGGLHGLPRPRLVRLVLVEGVGLTLFVGGFLTMLAGR